MEPYKIYVLQYARRDAVRGQYVLGDFHDNTPMDISYYMWAVTNGDTTFVVDCGFTEENAVKRNRQWLRHPGEQFDKVGIDPGKVEHVVLSHLHWDHAGYYDMFPKATFYVQEDEMAFWTGKYVRYEHFRRAMEVEDVVAMVRLNYDGRLRFTNGSEEIFPGIKVHKLGGHTKGVQVTEVPTASGIAVVASDAVHTYANLRANMPTPIIHDAPRYLDGYETMRRLAKDETYILPGHDSEVLANHPQVAEGIVVVQ